MTPREIYDEIVSAFETKYSFLGRDFAERALLVVSSWNIQKNTQSFMRLNGHLLLMYKYGFLKSTLLRRFRHLLGKELCTITNKVTDASIRGSVIHVSGLPCFIPPTAFDAPFIVCTEFGQVVGNETSGVVQELLNLLEEGETSVQSVKIASLPDGYKKELENKYAQFNLNFYKTNGFMYKVNTSWIVATNNTRFIRSHALESRFDVMSYSDNELTHEITKHVDKNEWYIDEDVVHKFREIVNSKRKFAHKFDLPDEIYTDNISPRESASLQRYGLSRLWWGLKTKVNDFIELFKKMRLNYSRSRGKLEDIIITLLKNNTKLTNKQIIDMSGYSRNSVYNAITSLYTKKIITKEKHNNIVFYKLYND